MLYSHVSTWLLPRYKTPPRGIIYYQSSVSRRSTVSTLLPRLLQNYKFLQPYKMKYIIICCTILAATFAQPPVQGVTPTNLLSSSDQHASFSFVRPGLTQTAFAFSGPSSHQSFTSSIGDAHLAQKVLPNIANALAYRNPGLGVFPGGPSAHNYATAPIVPPTYPSSFTFVPAPSTTGNALNPALAYYQQLQQYQQPQPFDHHPAAAIYQQQLAQLIALRQAQLQSQAQSQANPQPAQTQQVLEQVESQQEEQQQPQSLLGISYSPAPSVARVKVSGNGYKFAF